MNKLKTDSFMDYAFLSELTFSPAGKNLAVTVKKADREKNSYTSEIWVKKDGPFRRLTSSGSDSSFVWTDEETLVFCSGRDTDKNYDGPPKTDFYRICMNGGEAVKAFTLPLNVSEMKYLGEGNWLISASVDPACPERYLLSKEEEDTYRAGLKKEADYEVFEAIPFCHNGGGWAKKNVNVLFLWKEGDEKPELITDPAFTADSPAVIGSRIYYLSTPVIPVRYEAKSSVRCYDMAEKKDFLLRPETDTDIYFLEAAGDKLLAQMVKEERFRITDDASLYVIDTVTGEAVPLTGPVDTGDSTGSDSRMGANRGVKGTGKGLYFIRTVGSDAILSFTDFDGNITDIAAKRGAAGGFDVSVNGDVVLCAMYDGLLQEIYSVRDGKTEKISSFNEEVLRDVWLPEYREVSLISEGVDVKGWVLLPPGYEEMETCPAILDIHGGPRTVYSAVFCHEMNVWASMGYAVMFCNPLGGSGGGLAFADITAAYGQTDYRNIMDFTDEVLKLYPKIDPKRVGVTGGSYGGFMTNWIVGHTDRFACAATQRSISNWISFYGVSDIGYFFTKSQIGDDIYTQKGTEQLWDMSPLKYVSNVKTPLLFIHSDEDYRCPLEQGLQFYTAVKELGVESRFVMFHGENHELSRGGKPLHRLRRLDEITNWMEKHLK